MKHIFLNLKRFDIPKALGGVNAIAPVGKWGSYIVERTQEILKQYDREQVEFAMYFPEAHLLSAIGALRQGSPLRIGCQGVYREDTAIGETSARLPPTARPMRQRLWVALLLLSVIAKSGRTRQESCRKLGLPIRRR